MFRTFTLPLTATYASIWDLMISEGFIDNRGYIPNTNSEQIIPDRVMELDVRPADANSGDITYQDQFEDPGTEQVLANMSKRSNRNSICLRDYLFADTTEGDALVVDIESA